MMTASLLAVVLLVGADPQPAPVDYAREVKPLLAARCYACHGSVRQKGDLRLDTVAALKKGGANGPAVTPGMSGESLLVQRVRGEGKARRMPPEAEGEKLEAAQVELLRRWIDEGANGPTDEKPEADPRDHWAFRSPVKPAVPKVKNAEWGRNPIDAFLAGEQERLGLKPQPAVEKRLLLRRVYLDLIGLPPTWEQMEAFVKDDAPDAYEKVVDKLLASPQYGERWGRHWMDVWRYSDWWGLGAEVRNSQKHIWQWRDWIVEALNEDKGYERMVLEMLAADELTPTDDKALRATGYLVRQYFKFNRTTWLDETIEHTSKAFLGLTFNCAKCHDHKYDPISQVDYYRFRAFFEPYQIRHDMLPGEADLEKMALPRAFDCNLDVPTYLHVRGDERNPRKDRSLSPGVPEFLTAAPLVIKSVELPPEVHSPGLRAHVLDTYLREADAQLAAARKQLAEAQATVARLGKESPKESVGKVVAQDDFAKENGKLWEKAAGDWVYEGGRLRQGKDGNDRAVLRLKELPPADFEAEFHFRITGGKVYRSVGVSFDVEGARETLVYLSAHGPGPKLQIAYKDGGDYVYPADGTQARQVPLDQTQKLLVRVRGSLVNVSVNGMHALGYRLPHGRKAGRIELITYDAQAAFEKFELRTLPEGTTLVEPGKGAAPAVTPEQAAALVVLAEKQVALAELMPRVWKARAAADRAVAIDPKGEATKSLRKAAAEVEKLMKVAQAEVDLARAALELLQAPSDKKKAAEQKQQAAKAALDKATKEPPGDGYAPLRGSLKTLESNLDTEEGRRKPFPTTSTGRRSALAQWIADPKNPLTARVAVNHIWARHFGQPLVPTVFDFGRKGTPPTHPALLDYLAVEFMEHKWSMKHLHRLMVTSQAYRLTTSTAGAAEANRTLDADNRFYWRRAPQRMEAEVIRDSLLSLSGELDLARGGPSIEEAGQEASKRRSLYFFHSANDRSHFLTTFDEADPLECYRRRDSIVPQQALALTNSKFAQAQAEAIARKLAKEGQNPDDATFVKHTFVLLLATEPSAEEQKACAEALTKLQALFKARNAPDPAGRARAQLVGVLLNHNDFVTIR